VSTHTLVVFSLEAPEFGGIAQDNDVITNQLLTELCDCKFV
jgi:hypothetical protein